MQDINIAVENLPILPIDGHFHLCAAPSRLYDSVYSIRRKLESKLVSAAGLKFCIDKEIPPDLSWSHAVLRIGAPSIK